MKGKSFPVYIKTFETDYSKKNIVSIPLKLAKGSAYIFDGKLQLGSLILDVVFYPNNTDNTIKITYELLEKLNIPEGLECNAKFENNIISLGPVIGIFVNCRVINRIFEGSANFRINETVNSNEDANTVLYYFCYDDIDFINHRIDGTYYNPVSKVWEKRQFPFPDVLYDKGGSRSRKYKVISKYVRRQFEKLQHIKKINSQHYFDKWDTYKKLSRQKGMKPFLPKTVLFKKMSDLKKMLQESNTIYIKNRYGSNGRGVIRISKQSDSLYLFSRNYKTLEQKKFKSFKALSKKLKPYMKDKKMIIQSAIDLLEVDNRIVDLRATVQRNGSGELGIYAHPVRIATPDSPVTSTKSGSTVYQFVDFFKGVMHYSEEEINQLKAEIESFLLNAYYCIEKVYGTFGEIGIDFALDKDGKLWFIECNAKPGKDTLYKACGKEIIRKAFLNPLEYGKYISGF